MKDTLLEATGLTKTYGTTHALDHVDLRLHRGESVAVMGPSGSGKTTLLHCLAAILRPDAGSVTLATESGDQRIDALSEESRAALRRQAFGFVFQQGLLLPELTAAENVALPLLLIGTRREDSQARARELLADVGMSGLDERRLGQLSGGQVQRVAIARAQAVEPLVVFADEPTGALDSQTSDAVLTTLLRATVGVGRTLVVVTHDETVAARCSRVIRLTDGRIVSDSASGDEMASTAARPAGDGDARHGDTRYGDTRSGDTRYGGTRLGPIAWAQVPR